MKRVLDDDNYGIGDGYASSVGSESARLAISNRYLNRFSVKYDPKVTEICLLYCYL